ncbi:MAG: TolC family protein [Phycisphaerales bacterium]
MPIGPSALPESAPEPAARTPALLALLALLPLIPALAACNSMDTIDQRVERFAQTRAMRINAPEAAPRFPEPPDPKVALPESNIEPSETVNPSSDQLRYRTSPTNPEMVLAQLEEFYEPPSNALELDLVGSLEQAQQTGREYIRAEEDFLLASIRLLIEQHRWSPRVFNDITAAIDAEGVSGDYTTALNVINELRVTQRLPYGGEVEARLLTAATRQLTNIVGDEYQQANDFILGASFPLLRDAGTIAREDLIQAERDLVYAAREFENFRRNFLVDIAGDYFQLVSQLQSVRNQERRIRSIELLFERTKALVDAGRRRPFELKNVEQNLLTSQNALINQREAYTLALDRFKIRLGLDVADPVVLRAVAYDLPDPDFSIELATELALRYRLDFQNEIDRVVDQRRAVANARNQLLPDLDVALEALFETEETNDFVESFGFDLNDTDYNASVTLGLPLDREIERLNLRSAMVNLERAIRSLAQFRDNLVLEARRAVREIRRARFSLQLQQQAIEINELRLEELLIKQSEVDAQSLLDAEDELLTARNEFDAALTDFQIAILQFLLTTGQLRVAPDGSLMPLPGLDIQLREIDTSPVPTDPPAPVDQIDPVDIPPTDPPRQTPPFPPAP